MSSYLPGPSSREPLGDLNNLDNLDTFDHLDKTGPMEGPLDYRPAGRLDSGLHWVVIGQLVMGVAFLGLVAIWGLMTLGLTDSTDLRWLAPLPWLIGGAAGLVGMALNGPRDRKPTRR